MSVPNTAVAPNWDIMTTMFSLATTEPYNVESVEGRCERHDSGGRFEQSSSGKPEIYADSERCIDAGDSGNAGGRCSEGVGGGSNDRV